jgi:hypothetical protein
VSKVSKGIKSYADESKPSVIRRREQSGSMGLGYWGAIDALKKIAENKK